MQERTKDPRDARIAELEELHGKENLAVAKLPDGRLVVARKPTLTEWESYQQDAGKRSANRGLALQCGLEPDDPEKLAEVFEHWAALPGKIADALSDLAGVNHRMDVDHVAGRAYGTLPDGTPVELRRPSQSEWEEFNEQLGKKPKGEVYRGFVELCRVKPGSPEDLAKAFTTWPAFNVPTANALAILVGNDIELTVKKG